MASMGLKSLAIFLCLTVSGGMPVESLAKVRRVTNVAQKGSKEDGKNGGGRRKILQSEGRTKGSKTNIDFEAGVIDGERRLPAGVAIGGAKQDNEYDLINLRLRWHPEMIKSTSNLETGKGQ